MVVAWKGVPCYVYCHCASSLSRHLVDTYLVDTYLVDIYLVDTYLMDT